MSLIKYSMLAILPLAAQNAFAQYSYNDTVGDLNAIWNPPMNINETICDGVSPNNPHAYRACTDGVSAARWMAEKHARNAGKFLGCMDGFYQGIWDGYQATVNPSAETTAAAAAYMKGITEIKTAKDRAIELANKQATTASGDQIVNRYRAVIGRKDARGNPVLPNKTLEYPAIDFTGFDNGYDYDLAQGNLGAAVNFTPVYQAGWVNSSSPFSDRIAAQKAYMLQGQYAKNLCDINQTIFGRTNTPVYTIWDYFRAQRKYDFQNYGWNNGRFAWDVYNNDEKTLEQYQSYTRLNNLTKTVTETIAIKEKRLKLDGAGNPIPVKNPDGTPVLNSSGQPTYQMEEVITGYKNETKTVPLTSQEITDLKNMYANGFITAYERYYARQYASQAYHQEGIDKYAMAKLIGNGIGTEVAQYSAKKHAYDDAYKLVSTNEYAKRAKENYEVSFKTLLNIFETNSVVEFTNAKIVGTAAHTNYFVPGESLKLEFGVVNLGEVSTKTGLTMASIPGKISATSGMEFLVPALSAMNLQSPVMGTVDNSTLSGDLLDFRFGITNAGNLNRIAAALNTAKNETITLRDFAEISRVAPTMDTFAGTLRVDVEVSNPINEVAPTVSDVSVVLNNALGTQTRAFTNATASQGRQSILVDFSSLDPMALINAGGLSGQVQSIVGGKVVFRQNFSVNTPLNREALLVRYFDALATAKTTNAGTSTIDNRIGELATILNAILAQDVDGKIKWVKNDEFKQTILADIQRVYQESVIQGKMNSAAQTRYTQLANLLARQSAHLKTRGLFNDKKNKKAFLKEIAVISPGLSTNPKDFD